ncbi:MAG: ankyrin repeat domain-containing protein [Nitrospinales bacterium]
MKSIALILCLVLFVSVTACERSRQEARQEMSAIGLPFSPEAFYHAVETKSYPTVELFLDAGMTEKPGVLAQALLLAVHAGNRDIIDLLLKRGADINSSGTYASLFGPREATPLFVAVFDLDKPMIGYLFERGADVHAKNKYGDTVLMPAAETGDIEIVKLLLDRGADVKSQSTFGATALLPAVESGNLKLVRLLLDRGADVNAKMVDGVSALFLAAKRGYEEIGRLLLERGADINAENQNGVSALPLYAHLKKFDMVRYLVEQGADVRIKPRHENEQSLLVQAIQNQREDLARLLVEKGADIHYRNRGGWTALMYAAVWGEREIVRLLLDRGADINLQNNNGNTALFEAIKHKNTAETVKLLLARGAKTRIGKKRRSALKLAESYGDPEIIRLLKRANAGQ